MHFYKNGNYVVCIMDDGTKIRKTEEDEFIPSFAENCDVKITDKCSQGCPFCYEGCTREGRHGDLFKYPFINSLHPYTELALNGNDMDHPDLEKFLEFLKEKKIFTNITVNQNQFFKNYDKLAEYQSKKLIYGIGVSIISGRCSELVEKVKTLKNVVLHTIVGILSPEDIDVLKNNNLKILLLGYKDLKRGVDFHSSNNVKIEENKMYLYEYLGEMTTMFDVVSFDNLAIQQLDVKRIMTPEDWDEFYMGDDGHYTFYIDMVKGEYSKNSLSQDRYPISDKTVDEMFNDILSKN